MSQLPDPAAAAADDERVGSVARGWAVVTAVLVSAAVPLVYLQVPVEGSTSQELEEPTSLWSALGEVLLARTEDFGTDAYDGLAGRLAFARLGVVLLAAGLALALTVGVRWVQGGPQEAGLLRRTLATVLLLAGVLLVLVGGSLLGDPSGEEGLSRGLDPAAALLLPVVIAFLVHTAPPEPVRSRS